MPGTEAPAPNAADMGGNSGSQDAGAERAGTVKTGDYSRIWAPSWNSRSGRRIVFDGGTIVAAALALLCAIGLYAAVRGLGAAAAESAAAKADLAAIIAGDFMPLEKKERVSRIRKQGIGLRFKIASFTIALSLLIVVIVSVPLYYMMTLTQRETLLRGLWDRSAVLLEGLASSAQAYLSAEDIAGLGLLLRQTDTVPEWRYITITGPVKREYAAGDSRAFNDTVWATNDPDILAKINPPELVPGLSQLTDTLSPRLEQISRQLNGGTGPEAANMSRRMGSEPAFSTEYIPSVGKRFYIFFRPIVYRHEADNAVCRVLIRLAVSIDSIVEAIFTGQQRLLRIIIIVALAALAIGVIGALLLSSLIIRPMRDLVRHVELIRDTEDKTKLAGMDIHIATNDEIAMLGNTINGMTASLVQAAVAASDLSIGKEIQKKFIPLDTDRDGNKLSSGYKDTPNAQFFGYYEGAKGVSGDYFDYLDLDGRYYAIIKCDVAGKGVPAAFIMIQVATMFLKYFKQWKASAQGMLIEELVYQINDFFETMSFKGRFAAFTLCLFDSEAGVLRFCNAGDNIIHYYDASEKMFKIKTLQ